MHVIVCLDNQNGMLFNRRRQSRDRAVIVDILQNLEGRLLKVRKFSEDIFPVDGETNDYVHSTSLYFLIYIILKLFYHEQAGNDNITFLCYTYPDRKRRQL